MRTTLLATLALASPALADKVAGTTAPDPAPAVASAEPDSNYVEEGGLARAQSYARKGVYELGAFAGMMLAPGFRNVNISPMLGWFVSEQLELSAIGGVSNIKAGGHSSTVWSALVEPSYHVPLTETTFGFIGMGIGTAYVSGLGAGLAIAPRLGANVLLGGRGVLTPSLSYEYTTHNPDEMDNITRSAVSSSLRINIGYTAMW